MATYQLIRSIFDNPTTRIGIPMDALVEKIKARNKQAQELREQLEKAMADESAKRTRSTLEELRILIIDQARKLADELSQQDYKGATVRQFIDRSQRPSKWKQFFQAAKLVEEVCWELTNSIFEKIYLMTNGELRGERFEHAKTYILSYPQHHLSGAALVDMYQALSNLEKKYIEQKTAIYFFFPELPEKKAEELRAMLWFDPSR